MFGRLAQLFPVEVALIREATAVRQTASTPNAKRNKPSADQGALDQAREMWKPDVERISKKIQKRKERRTKVAASRSRVKDAEELLFLEGCRETRVFKGMSPERMAGVIQTVALLQFSQLSTAETWLRTLNLVLTLIVRNFTEKLFLWLKKQSGVCQENQVTQLVRQEVERRRRTGLQGKSPAGEDDSDALLIQTYGREFPEWGYFLDRMTPKALQGYLKSEFATRSRRARGCGPAA